MANNQLSNGCYFVSEFQEKISNEFLEAFRDLARWLYKTLENEYDYLLSDEYIDETIRCNEYTFLATGEIF